jgi:hypothetical protein
MLPKRRHHVMGFWSLFCGSPRLRSTANIPTTAPVSYSRTGVPVPAAETL